MAAAVSLSRPLRKSAAEKVLLGLTSADVVPSRRVIPTKPPRNFEEELRAELGDIVQLIAGEYTKLFPNDGSGGNGEEPVSAEVQAKRLLYVLNTGGLYHDFKEKLKPRLQRVVKQRFDKAPESDEALDRDLTLLYSFLMKEVAVV